MWKKSPSKKRIKPQITPQFPYFSSQGYQVVEQLGQNWNAGRSTYKALMLKDETPVVIKEFRFHQGNWDSYKEIEREIQTLAKLKHPAIPNYLGNFETENSVCLVQEYIDASPLSLSHLTPDEVKRVAIQILEILVYLQSRPVLIFHRDIKPDNILLDYKNFQAYLVDFGLAREGSGTLGASTMFGGTPGFCPPEQLLARRLTCASDLYSLGATLIYLLSGNKPIAELINPNFEIDFHSSVPKNISFAMREWLSKMTQPDPKKRFSNAAVALQSLRPIEPILVDSLVSKDSVKQDRLAEIGVAPTVIALAIAAGSVFLILPPIIGKFKQLLQWLLLTNSRVGDNPLRGKAGFQIFLLAFGLIKTMLFIYLIVEIVFVLGAAQEGDDIKPHAVRVFGIIFVLISAQILTH
ncbi:serine/threonine protein kinase [Gloeothece verrucosa]|uniref:non-specific serine/threonine protein kinase n=1 Tax=Gloeothece verrucosa (strain PCC 7822) TaxID=497965 RepID=E0UMP8_GLOV7|nr:serine/threonine-protein kinase [Gloeothece verrucosa]ADN18228.1 serine/threonine protein kinase [Gloeothece verrucosa PCC 7822]